MAGERGDTERRNRSYLYDLMVFLGSDRCTAEAGRRIEAGLQKLVEEEVRRSPEPAVEGGAA